MGMDIMNTLMILTICILKYYDLGRVVADKRLEVYGLDSFFDPIFTITQSNTMV